MWWWLAVLSALGYVAAEGQPDEASSSVPTTTLSTSVRFPLLGLGCSSGLRRNHVKTALELGYRLLDTASAYRWGYREDEVGDAINESGIPREHIFLQTKIDPEDLGFEATRAAAASSLQRLKTSYVDLLLIHKPACWPGACRRQPSGNWQESWQVLQELHANGTARAVGMCDVTPQLLGELLRQELRPHVIQNWMDPLHQDVEMRRLCSKHGIQYQAYSTLGKQWLGRGFDRNPVLGDATLQRIAASHRRSVAEVLLNWAVRRGVAVIPASRRPERLAANLGACNFSLTQAELEEIDGLDGRGSRPTAEALKVTVSFKNEGESQLSAYWVRPGTTVEEHIGEIEPGAVLRQRTLHSHKFRFKEQVEGGFFRTLPEEFLADSSRGSEQVHVIRGGRRSSEL